MPGSEVRRYHFSGVAGAGMSPLARLMRAWGHDVQGSDRSLDQGQNQDTAAELRAAGIRLVPQDGAAVGAGLDRFVYSTAVEAETPEMRAAKAHGLELVPRPQLLAEVVDGGAPGVAISGTSGKSTVTGMLAWILREAGVDATILGGAALAGERGVGCFRAGPRGGIVVAEACESDGTLVGYHPTVGLLHNISRDHAELDQLGRQFDAFARHARTLLVNLGNPAAVAVGASAARARGYGLVGDARPRIEPIAAGPDHAEGVLHLDGEHRLRLRQPGLHNLENAAAAAAAASELGVAPAAIASALATFPGVARRFEVVGVTEGGIRVVDDYAHNVEKIRAAMSAAQAGCHRLLAVFQPHGFGPARFLRPELKAELPGLLREHDRFCYAEIYYAGGSVAKDISSRVLADDLPRALRCGYAADHAAVLSWVADEAMPGDTVLLMGARDPRLPALARAIADLL